MRYCHEHGIPHSRYVAEWTKEDKAKEVAFMLEEGQRCPSCGTAHWEWEENKYAYTTEEVFCQGCYIKSRSSEDNNSLPGTTIELVKPTPEVLAAKRRNDMRRMR